MLSCHAAESQHTVGKQLPLKCGYQTDRHPVPLMGQRAQALRALACAHRLSAVPTSSPLLSRSTNMCLQQKGREVKDSSAEAGGQWGTQVTGTVALTPASGGTDLHLSLFHKRVGASSLPTLSQKPTHPWTHRSTVLKALSPPKT